MLKTILLVGVGGQGTILVSKILSEGLMMLGYDVKMSEIHGMSQRGGSVTTQIKYGEKVYSPIVVEGEADLIIAFEKVEALRALPFLKNGGQMILDDHEIYPMPVLTGAATYPHEAVAEMKKVVGKLSVVQAFDLAAKLGNSKAQNIVLLGALVKAMGLEAVDWKKIIADYVPKKAVEMNMAAYDAGYNM